MNWCDPCAADPALPRRAARLGVFWLGEGDPQRDRRFAPPRPTPPRPQPANVFLSRLHLRYTADTFPEDLRFQETGDRQNFQGRFVLQRAWKGSPAECPAARQYFEQLIPRQQQRAETLARLTGWELSDILDKMPVDFPTPAEDDGRPWWKKLWGSDDEGGQ